MTAAYARCPRAFAAGSFHQHRGGGQSVPPLAEPQEPVCATSQDLVSECECSDFWTCPACAALAPPEPWPDLARCRCGAVFERHGGEESDCRRCSLAEGGEG